MEQLRLRLPQGLDRLVGRLPPQRLEVLGEVLGRQVVRDVASELAVGLVMVGPNRSLLEGAHHPLGLAVRPRVVGLGEAVLYAASPAELAEGMGTP